MSDINKVIYGDQTLIDLTEDTLTDASQLQNGVTAHDRTGTIITGTASIPTKTSDLTNDSGFVDADGAAVAAGIMMDYWGDYPQQTVTPSGTGATAVGIVRNKTLYTCNGTSTSSGATRVRLNGAMQRTTGTGTIDGWAGMDFESGHTYAVELRLLSGTVTPPSGSVMPSISVYRKGYHTMSGQFTRWNDGGRRVFTAEVGVKYNIVFYIEKSTVLTDAVFEIKCRDLTNQFADITRSTRIYTSPGNANVQGGCVVDGKAYCWDYTNHGLTAVDLRTGESTFHAMWLSHGNSIAHYNGKLYVSSMDDNGRIYIVNLATMAIESYVDFTVDGVVTVNSGICYDPVNNRFILKIAGAFAFADTSLTYTGQVPRPTIGTATGQGMETDGTYIYLPMSSSSQIDVFDMTGAWVKSITILGNTDEPEDLSYADGVWYLLTSVSGASGPWYWDAITIRDTPGIEEICGFAALMDNIPTAVDIGAYELPSTGIPKTDLASDVQTSLDKADSALQSYTETDPTVPSWAKASSKPNYTASEVGAVASNQGAGNAGKFLVVGSDGVVVPVTMATWQGGSY